MKKRATGLLLALLMILSLIPGTASAETASPTGELAVVGGEVKTGGSVTVRVDLIENPGIAGLYLKVTYPVGFTLTDVKQGAALSGEGMEFTKSGGIETGNSASFVWDSPTNSTDTGTLLELTFLVAEDAALGEQSITVTCGSKDAWNQDLKPVKLETQTGTVRVTVKEMTGVTVSGTATSFGDADADVTIQLIESGTSEAEYEKTVKGNSAGYSIDGVLPGSYTMKVMKKNHVTREYAVTVGAEHVKQDVKICLLGDVTGDGRVNAGDHSRLYKHISKTELFW